MQNQDTVTKIMEQRKRGRPSGKQRTPLSLEEKRARNALYERERRNELAEAMAELAAAAGCDATASKADLLAAVVAQVQNAATRDPTESAKDMKRRNDELLQQIGILKEQLGKHA